MSSSIGRVATSTPSQPRTTLPFSLSWMTTFLAMFDGDGEADADIAAGRARGEDVAVDADDLAFHVDERAAASCRG